MYIRIWVLLLLFSLAEALEQVHVPNRVFIDREIGACFYVPYNVYIPGYKGKECYVLQVQSNGRIDLHQAMRVRYFSRSLVADQTLNEVLNQELRGKAATITEYDYRAGRLAVGDHAPVRVSAMRAQGDAVEALICQRDKQIAGLLIDGRMDVTVAESIIQSFEMLGGSGAEAVNFRQQQSAAAQCFDAAGVYAPIKSTSRPEDWDKALEMESQHFHITFICAPKLVDNYLEMLEGLYVVLKEWFPIERDPHFKYEIHITKTTQQFGSVAARILQNKSYETLANDGAAFGGFFSTIAAATFTYTDKIKNAQMDAELQLAHEVVHQYLFINSNNNYTLPMWFNEALAVMFESGEYNSKSQVILPPTVRLKALRQYYKKETPVRPVRDYVEQDKPFTNVHEYAESYIVVHYLLHEENGPQLLSQYWKQLQQGENGKTLFHEVFLRSRLQDVGDRDAYYEQWQKDVVKYVESKKSDKKVKK